MTFEELGQELEKKRLESRLTYQQVSSYLKINPNYIQAMEMGNREALPHMSYAKGFLRSYARFLSIPEEEYSSAIADLNRFAPEQKYVKVETKENISESNHSIGRWIGLAVSLLGACVIVWAVWHFGAFSWFKKETPATQAPLQTKDPHASVDFLKQNQKKEQKMDGQASLFSSQASSDKSADMNAKREETPLPPREEKKPLESVVPANSPWGTLQGNATIAGANGMATDAQNLINQENPNLPASDPQRQAIPSGKAHQIVITAQHGCWLQATVESEKQPGRVLKKGEVLTIPFDGNLKVRFGNLRGVKILYDGQEYLPRSRYRTLYFPPQDR